MKIKKFGWIIMMCTAIAIGNVMSSCSDDTNGENGGNGGNGSTDPEVLMMAQQPTAKVYCSIMEQNWAMAINTSYSPAM